MKSSISIIVFLALAVIAWWSITEDYSDDDELLKTKSSRYIEIFMNEFQLTAMGETGAPQYTLNGKRLERYNDSDTSEIEQPIFQILETNKEWIISADVALINDKKETIQLEKNVVMQQQNIEPAVTIRTQSMLFNTKTQIAQTQAQVDITQGESHLKSIGMIYNNTTSELELSSDVSGHYLPYE